MRACDDAESTFSTNLSHRHPDFNCVETINELLIRKSFVLHDPYCFGKRDSPTFARQRLARVRWSNLAIANWISQNEILDYGPVPPE